MSVVSEAIDHLNAAKDLGEHPLIKMSPHWSRTLSEKISSVMKSGRTPCEVVSAAQTLGFNHRVCLLGSSIEKAFEVARKRFGNLVDETVLMDSPLSRRETVNQDGYSRIMVWHANSILVFKEVVKAHPGRVLEIGGGMGELCRLFLLNYEGVKWVFVDFPESLLFCEVFIRENFPGVQTSYCMNEFEDAQIVFVPVQNVDKIPAGFDTGFNIGSFQEMMQECVMFWMDFIDEKMVKAFISTNYFLNAPRVEGGTYTNDMSFWPTKRYAVRHFELNSPLVTLDSPIRWLTCVVERDDDPKPFEGSEPGNYFDKSRLLGDHNDFFVFATRSDAKEAGFVRRLIQADLIAKG